MRDTVPVSPDPLLTVPLSRSDAAIEAVIVEAVAIVPLKSRLLPDSVSEPIMADAVVTDPTIFFIRRSDP